MRIGIDASRAFVPQPTGTERYAFEIVSEMMKIAESRKHEWILYVRNLDDKSYSLLDNNQRDFLESVKKLKNVKVTNIQLPYLWTQVGLAVRTWLDRLDVLWIPAHTLPVVRKPGIMTVVTIHGIEYEWLPAYENWLQRWYLPLSTKYAVAFADRVIAVSEFTKQQLITRLGASEKKIRVVNEGVRITKNSETENRQVMKKFGLQKGKYILFVGTVQPRKNLEKLIQAFSTKHFGLIKLVIAGKLGWQYEEVLTAPERYGIADKVDILGYISDIERQGLLENCLVYVQPSITEGYGLPVLEAMASGAPVATSTGGALEELVRDSGSGGEVAETFNPGFVADIARAISRMIEGGEKYRQAFRIRGLQKSKNLTWVNSAKKTLEILITTSQ